MSQQKKSKYASIGNLIWQSEFDDNGNRIEGKYKMKDGKKLFAIKLDKKTKVVIDGVDMTGKTLYLETMEDNAKGKLERGIIQQEEYDQKIEDYGPNGKYEFLRYQITAKLS